MKKKKIIFLSHFLTILILTQVANSVLSGECFLNDMFCEIT